MGAIKAWSPSMGAGALDWHTGGGTFTPDDGSAARALPWASIGTGRPGAKPPKSKRAEWEQWLTFELRSGETLLFRRGGAP